MASLNKYLPGFKSTCIMVGCLNILMASTMLIQGIPAAMEKFQIPENILISAHYIDAMFWVFLHMAMIGILIIIIGLLAENSRKQILAARILVLMHCVYLYLDIQTSDNPFGNALYHGSESLVPIFVDIFYILLFFRLSFSARHKPVVAN